MDANEFWCRSFLAAMTGNYTISEWDEHSASAAYCEKAADAALAVAQRRGMVAGKRAAYAAPDLERVEFKAWPKDGNQWTLRAPGIGALLVPSGCERFSVNGAAVHIKWGETSPPKPIEVWIERGA